MNQIAIFRKQDTVVTSFFENEQLFEVDCSKNDCNSRIGNIYVGKVSNVVPNINAAFIDIGQKTMCYLSQKEFSKPLVRGDECIVQVKTDAVKQKSPTVTSKIELVGRYVVLAKGEERINLSSRIPVEEEERLRNVVSTELLQGFTLTIRTNAKDASDDIILHEFHKYREIFITLNDYASMRTCYSCLYEAPTSFLECIREADICKMDRIITEDKEIHNQVTEYLQETMSESPIPVVLYEDESYPLDSLIGFTSKLSKCLQKKVWLPSGGSIVIEPTEALTSIDVNTEKAIRVKGNSEDTFFRTNIEAAEEIGHQLRVRNLSGIIIIDFIDMRKKQHKYELIQHLRTVFEKDNIRTNVIDITSLGLIEVTRMKRKRPLHEIMTKIC